MSEKIPNQESLLNEIQFQDLEKGDEVIVETKSGSAYKFLVKDNSDKILVSIERSSNHSVKEDDTTRWAAIGLETLFEMRGSCLRTAIIEGAPFPIGRHIGHFVVGERAWLGTELEGIDRTMITTPVENIRLNKSTN